MQYDDSFSESQNQLLDHLRSVRPALNKLESLLISGNYDVIEASSSGEGMPASTIEAAVNECERILCRYPEDIRARQVTRRKEPKTGKETVTFLLWTVEDNKPAVRVTCQILGVTAGETKVAIQGIALDI